MIPDTQTPQPVPQLRCEIRHSHRQNNNITWIFVQMSTACLNIWAKLWVVSFYMCNMLSREKTDKQRKRERRTSGIISNHSLLCGHVATSRAMALSDLLFSYLYILTCIVCSRWNAIRMLRDGGGLVIVHIILLLHINVKMLLMKGGL